MSGEDQFSLLQDTLQRMEQQLSTVCTEVEELKRSQSLERVAQLPRDQQPGTVQSTMAQSVNSTPVISVDGTNDSTVATRLSWSEQMELGEDEQSGNSLDTSGNRSKSEKLSLTKVEKETEEFLHESFTALENDVRKDIRKRFIVPDAPFTMAPRLDKVMAAECSKSTKSADQAHSRIQALFLDAVGPLTGLLDAINKGQELSIDDVEAAVKAALNLIGSASCHCNTLRRTTVLEEYNKDLVSFAQDSDLFTSATTTLFGPSFPEKAVEHLKQLQTLRQARTTPKTVISQGFAQAQPRYAQRGGRANYLQRRQSSQPYSRGGYSRGRGAASASQGKWLEL